MPDGRSLLMPSLLISPGLARRLIGHAARELHRHAHDGAVHEATHERVAAVDVRPRHDAAREGVALVEDVRPLVEVEALGVGAAGVTLHRQHAGDRRVVFGLAERVGEVELQAVDVAAGELRGEVPVGGLAERLDLVDDVVARVEARLRVDRRAEDRAAVRQPADRVDGVDVADDRQVVAAHVRGADRAAKRSLSWRSICRLFCQLLATRKSRDTVVSVFGVAPAPADSTAGNAGAPAVAGWKVAAARAFVPSLLSDCS